MRRTWTFAIAAALVALAVPGSAAAAPGPCTDPTVHPMGCPVQTITSAGAGAGGAGGIKIGDQTYPGYPPHGGWVRMVVLDAGSLAPSHGGDQLFDAGESRRLLAALDAVGPDDLVILSGQGIPVTIDSARSDALTTAFEKLGGNLKGGSTPEGAKNLASGNWSLIGRLGASGGTANQNVDIQQAGLDGFLDGSGGERGSLNGYLQVVGTSAFQFVSPEYASIDTSAPGSTGKQNVITVDGTSYPSVELPEGQFSAAIQMLLLDPDTLAPDGHATYFVRFADGTLASSYLDGLQNQLYALVRQSASTRPPLVVLQSFGNTGNHGKAQQIGNARTSNNAWVADTLPFAGLSNQNPTDNYDFYRWCANGENGSGSMDGYACDPFPDPVSGLGTQESITAVLGEIAGVSARNQVANLGSQGQSEDLSFVGSPQPYSDGQVELRVGKDGKRLVAVLRRSRQSQWEPRGASRSGLDAARTDRFDPASMWEVVFGTPHEPWPLQGARGSSLSEANKYIVGQLFPGNGYTDVRRAYVPQISASWDTKRSDMDDLAYPRQMRARFSRADFDQLRKQLDIEFGHIADIQKMTANYKSVFLGESVDETVKLNAITTRIISDAFKDHDAYKEQEATVDEGPSVGSALYFAADAIDFFAPEGGETVGLPLGLFAGVYDFFSELYSSSEHNGSAEHPFGEPQQITDKASELGTDLQNRYAAMAATLDHLEVLHASDWGRLQAAGAMTANRWSLDDDSPAKKLLVQSLATAAESAVYQALLPIAYDQWVISPWWTEIADSEDNQGPADIDGKPGPLGYWCKQDGGGSLQLFGDHPGSSMGWIRYEADGTPDAPFRNHFTGRVLVSKADAPRLVQGGEPGGADNNNYPAVSHRGAGADPALTDKLFRAPRKATHPNAPDGLGLSKAAFFGLPAWTTPRLQCGVPLAYKPGEAE